MDNLKKYFDLSSNNNVINDLNNFASRNNLKLSDEYLYIMEHHNFDQEINIYYNLDNLEMEIDGIKIHHYIFGRLFDLPNLISCYLSFREIDFRCKQDMPEYFTTFDADKFLFIADIVSTSYLNPNVYLNCGDIENGSLYFIDYDMQLFEIMEKRGGIPLKVKIADSFEHLIEISERQAHMRPDDFV